MSPVRVHVDLTVRPVVGIGIIGIPPGEETRL